MSDEKKIEQSPKQEVVQQKTIIEGYQPIQIEKGYQPAHDKSNLTAGYQPNQGNLNPNNPPRGGSGVPPLVPPVQTSPSENKDAGKKD